MRVIIITIGDEILIGQVVDTNSAWIGQQLANLGVTVQEIKSIKDNEESIKNALNYGINEADLVIMTGGLGPTKDDITKKSIADYMGADLVFHQETYERIVALFAKFGRSLKDSHKHQCNMPTNATLLLNRMGTAPGMLFEFEDTLIISMPGVPYEMKAIMQDHILPMVSAKIDPNLAVYSRTVMTAGEGETTIEDNLASIIDRFDPTISIAYLPSLGSVRVRITGRGDLTQMKPKVDKITSEISTELGDIVYGFDDLSISQALMELCISKGLWLGAAESCTGGYISHRVTSDSGSSAYYKGSLVTYTNELKQQLLGVKGDTLQQFGAVSEQTVIQMAKGALKILDVDLVISVSGIAGPSGGSKDKPVGTIWMCIANECVHHAFKINATKDRSKNIEYAGNVGLNALRKFVLKNY